MKDFVIYTGLRIALFIGCYAVLAAIWLLVWGDDGSRYLIWPFVAAAFVSSFLSLYLLKKPRERFAARVEARASRMTAKMQKVKAREDN